MLLNAQLTASRSLILPASAGYAVGATIKVRDPLGYAGGGKTLWVVRAGSDLINVSLTFTELVNLQHGMGEVIKQSAGNWGTIDSVRTAYTAIQAYSVIGNGGGGAGSGQIGELLQQGNANTGVSNGQIINIAQIAIPAGDWDIWGWAQYSYSPNNTIVTYWMMTITGTSLGNVILYQSIFETNTNNAIVPGAIVMKNGPRIPLRLTGAQTIYLTGSSGFSGGSCSIAGQMTARRVG